jgi:hypothetical protein
MSLVSIISMIVSPNVLASVSSQGLRGSLKYNRDHFSNDDLTIKSPISFDLLTITEEARFEETLQAESVPQQEIEAESVEIADETFIENTDFVNESIEVLPEVAALNV